MPCQIMLPLQFSYPLKLILCSKKVIEVNLNWRLPYKKIAFEIVAFLYYIEILICGCIAKTLRSAGHDYSDLSIK